MSADPPYAIIATVGFTRELKRFLKKHPDLRERYRTVVNTLAQDPFTPSLRLHKLSGTHDGLHAVSLNYAFRIILLIRITERAIEMYDIGDHDDVY